MPRAKNPITDAERSRRFEEEIRKRKEAGDFDPAVADESLERILKKEAKTKAPPDSGRR